MMKVKEYLVSEILDLKRDMDKVRMDIANRDNMIKAQHDRISMFEAHEIEYKAHINQIYGRICDVRKIINDNVLNISIKTEDLERLLKLLNIDDNEQEAPDEVPED